MEFGGRRKDEDDDDSGGAERSPGGRFDEVVLGGRTAELETALGGVPAVVLCVVDERPDVDSG